MFGHEAPHGAGAAVTAVEPAGRWLACRRVFGARHVVRRELVDEAGRDGAHPLPVPVPVRREEDVGAAGAHG